MNCETFLLKSSIDGLPLTGYLWELDEALPVLGLVVIAHGMAEHAQRYRDFAGALNKAGYVVMAIDHRGHGASPGPNGHGDFGQGGWNALVEDLAQVVRYAQSRFANTSTTLFGHSMGSFASQQFLLQYSNLIDRVVLSGSAAVDQLFAGLAKLRSESPDAGLNIHNRAFEYRTGYEWLTRDEQQVDHYVDDPWCGFELSNQSLMGLIGQAANLASPESLSKIASDLPMLLLAGSDDPVTGSLDYLNTLKNRYQQAGIRVVDTLYYDGGRHEMLNETNRQDVYRDVLEWLSVH